MQEIRDNTSVDPCLDLPNGLMRPYLAVPTYLMELWWNFLSYLGWLKDETFHLYLSYLASSLKSIRENMILWFLNIRHSGTLFGLWFLTSAQQLKSCILPAKGWSKKSYENFLNDLKNVFEMVWWRRRKWNQIKRVFDVEVFSSSQNIDFPFYLKRFLELFSILFFNTFSSSSSLSFFYDPSLENLGVLMIFRGEKSLLQKLLFEWNGMGCLSVNIGGGHIF
jgi:hypothetical protein